MLKGILESNGTQPGSEHLPEIVAMYGAEVLISEMKNPSPELVAQVRAIQATLDARASIDALLSGQKTPGST